MSLPIFQNWNVWAKASQMSIYGDFEKKEGETREQHFVKIPVGFGGNAKEHELISDLGLSTPKRN